MIPAEKPCGRCAERPRRKGQRWCHECHAANAQGHRLRIAKRKLAQELDGSYDRGPLCGVYFIKCDGFIKIGMGTNVVNRYQQIKTSNPHVTTPLGFVQRPTADGALGLESTLHERFAADKHQGEWFRESSALLEYIAEHAHAWPATATAALCFTSTWHVEHAS